MQLEARLSSSSDRDLEKLPGNFKHTVIYLCACKKRKRGKIEADTMANEAKSEAIPTNWYKTMTTAPGQVSTHARVLSTGKFLRTRHPPQNHRP